jgi:hypothetical protein
MKSHVATAMRHAADELQHAHRTVASAAAQPAAPIQATAASTAQEPLTRRERLHRRVRRQDALALQKPLRAKLTEATGAMLLAALLSLAYAIVANLLLGWHNPEMRQFIWFAAVTTLGAWAVIVPAKIWEGRRGETVARRSTMLVLGMFLGLIACALQSGFSLSMPFDNSILPSPERIGPRPFNDRMFDVTGGPLIWTHAAYFAFLFLVPPWWRQADARRKHRFHLGTAAMMGAWAYLLSFFWQYPQPWGVLAAVGISILAQIASPMDDPYEKPAAPAENAA